MACSSSLVYGKLPNTPAPVLRAESVTETTLTIAARGRIRYMFGNPESTAATVDQYCVIYALVGWRRYIDVSFRQHVAMRLERPLG